MRLRGWFAIIWIVAAGMLALAGGCKVDQQKEVALYRQVLDGGPATRPATTLPAPLPSPDQPLTLRELMHSANAHNERLKIQGETYVQSLIDKQRAVANFLPTVNFVPNYFRQDPVSGGTNDRLDVPVQGQMNLFNGFRDVANYRRTQANIAQRRWQLLDLQEIVLLDVAEVYYQVLRSEQSAQVLASSLATQEERVRDTRARQAVGVARPLDVFQTEAQAAQTRVLLTQARNDVQNGRTVLSFLTAYPVGDTPLADRFEVPETIPSEAELLLLAESGREDLAAAIAATEAARQGVQVAFGQYFPSVNLNLQAFLHRESSPTDSEWNGLLSANLPIFSAGRIEADVRTAWSQLRQANDVESLLRRQIIQDVRIAIQNLLTSRQRLVELQVQLDAADAAFRQAEASYRVGLATNLDRLQAQTALLSAQLQMTSERYDQKVAFLDLLRVTGRLSTLLPGRATTWPAILPTALLSTQPLAPSP